MPAQALYLLLRASLEACMAHLKRTVPRMALTFHICSQMTAAWQVQQPCWTLLLDPAGLKAVLMDCSCE